MSVARNGFRPARAIDYKYVKNVPVNALAKEVAVGDAVISVGGLIMAASGATNPTQSGYGIVLAVYNSANRPLTHQATKFIASGGVGRADVCYDVNMTYFVQCVTSVGTTDIGKNVMIDVSGANSRTGISGMSVDIPASASTGELFKIIGLAPTDPNTLTGYTQVVTGGGANNGVEVAWNKHFQRAATAAQ